MAIISGVTVKWTLSPRIIIIPTTETEVTLDDLQDTLQDLEDDEAGMVFPHLRNMSGGEDLGGGTSVGFTMELQNAVVGWATNVALLDSGTITTPDTTGETLTDSTGLFVTNGVAAGDMIVNTTDGSHASILDVVSETELLTDGLVGGTDDQFDSADTYEVYDWALRNISGGNLVAVDDVDASIDPIWPSFGNYVTKTSSSSATVSDLEDIRHASFDGGVHVDVTSPQTGSAYPSGNSANPVNNWPDAVIIDGAEGFNKYFVEKSTTLDNAEDYTDATFVGKSIIDTVLTVPAGTTLSKAEFFNVSLEGSLGDTTIMENCFLGETNTLNDVRGVIEACSIGPAKLTLGGTSSQVVRFVNCRGAGSQFSPPTINCGGDGPEVDIQDYVGQINIENKTGSSVFEISITGKLILDSTVTDGTIIVNGAGTLEDNSGVNAIVINNMIQGIHLQELWRLQGLEFGNPMTVTPTARSVQDQSISLGLTGDGVTSTVVTRQTDQTITLNTPLTADLLDDSDTVAAPTFTRASTATYLNPSDGLITSAAIDAPRFELEGLLIEESRENLLPQGSQFTSAAGWANTFGGGCTVTADTTTAPDGTSTADLIARIDGDNDAKNQNTITLPSSSDVTLSCFIKQEAAVISRLLIWDNNTGAALAWLRPRWVGGTPTIDASLNASNIIFEEYDNGWWRAMFTATTAGTVTTHQVLINPSMDGSGTNGNYYWGAQLEVGSFATSVIPTSGATVTRSADFLTYNDDSVVQNAAGTVICDVTPLYGSTTAHEGVVVNCTDAQAGPLYITNDTTEKFIISDGTLTASYDPTIVENTTVTAASRWGSSTIQAVAGGSAGSTAAFDGSFDRTPGTLYVGSTSAGNHMNGNIKNLKIYNVDRGATQLQIDTA